MPKNDPQHLSCAQKTAHIWRKSDGSWSEQIVPACSPADEGARPGDYTTPDDPIDISIWLIKADNARNCAACKQELSNAARIPDLWWTDYSRNSNGHFGCEELIDKDGKPGEVVTWTRFLVKILQNNDQDKYHWLKFNILIHWNPATNRTNILLFDLAAELHTKVVASLKTAALNQTARTTDPFWPYPSLVEHLIDRQDQAVWALRTLVRMIEKTRQVSPDMSSHVFTRMHDLARHAVHISETLEVGIDSIAALVDRHGAFITERHPGSPASSIHDRLLAFQNLLLSLRRRSDSNHQRLQNEIQLAFNNVSWRDAAISREIATATQVDSAAMKTIAMLTTAFLPATFVAAIFSTSFFSLNDAGSWVMSHMFWVYWAFAIPISLATTGWWTYWQKGQPFTPVKEDDTREDHKA
ncbi:hypothetical protein F5X68DRAFT_208813 [Plectosphaerella plurivora]|uniref:Uncharacterized protein n=1 Tax=Plectosphaerella plurivora TaxID=936078 RepID=A0A9P8VAV0_9PEZI|nr:hypothetical protein F5X68DRAFT_208813 [Plectosphaerella plurivora]